MWTRGTEASLSVVLVLFLVGTNNSLATTWQPWTNPVSGETHEYVALTTSLDWSSAENVAELLTDDSDGLFVGEPATLVCFGDAVAAAEAEYNWVKSYFGTDPHWIGGWQNHDNPDYLEPAGGWEWINGESWEFVAWNSGEPNDHPTAGEDHLMYGGAGVNWNDQAGSSPRIGIVERVPEPATLALLTMGAIALVGRRR